MSKRRNTAKGRISDGAFPVTSNRPPDPQPAPAIPTETGAKMGYRDGDNCIEYMVFSSGVIPNGWFNSPDKCKTEYEPSDLVKVN